MDNIIAQLIKEYVKKGSFNQIAMSIRSLIKGCESLKRCVWHVWEMCVLWEYSMWLCVWWVHLLYKFFLHNWNYCGWYMYIHNDIFHIIIRFGSVCNFFYLKITFELSIVLYDELTIHCHLLCFPCRSIKSNLSSSKGVNQPSSIFDDHVEVGSARKSKVYIRQLFSRKRSETSQSLHSTKDRSVSELNTEEQWVKYFDEFR